LLVVANNLLARIWIPNWSEMKSWPITLMKSPL
jgi:hypothetical protein